MSAVLFLVLRVLMSVKVKYVPSGRGVIKVSIKKPKWQEYLYY